MEKANVGEEEEINPTMAEETHVVTIEMDDVGDTVVNASVLPSPPETSEIATPANVDSYLIFEQLLANKKLQVWFSWSCQLALRFRKSPLTN